MKPDTNSNKFPEVNLPNLSGEELLQCWKEGSQQAADVLAQRYWLRLVALVAGKLNQRFRRVADPEDIVQSALGSFFDAAANSRIQVSNSLSLWRLLATFARRKMSKTIEKHDAVKRGDGKTQVSLVSAEQFQADSFSDASKHESDAVKLFDILNTELPDNLQPVLHGLLAGQSQKEIAAELKVDERTVRRRVVELRTILNPDSNANERHVITKAAPTNLPQVEYSEFVLGKLIGSGGFGKVYRAAMQQDGSIVAVKFLRKGFWLNDRARQSFLREIEMAAEIQHAGVIRYLGWGESPHGGPYVISQWIDGKTLHQTRSVTPEVFSDYLRQVCLAMAEVHQEGIVHGDLTPSNILINHSDRITITDFGFSQRPLETAESASNCDQRAPSDHRDLLLGGTVGFAAPEQFSNAFGAIGPKTDVYALGAIAFWYLTGRAPHQTDSIGDSVGDTISESNVRFDLPSSKMSQDNSIYNFAKLALRKSVADRPSTATLVQTFC